MRRAERFFRALLWLYPADHRRDYGPLMEQLFRDQYRDARRCRLGPARLWLRLLPDVVLSAWTERRDLRRGKLMNPSLSGRVDKFTTLVFLVPALVALLLLFDPDVLRGELIPYGLAALIGAGGYLLGRAGKMPRLRLWGGYAAGFLIFALGFLLINIWSPTMNTGIRALQREPVVGIRHALHLAACLITLAVFYLTARRSIAPLRIALVVLALNLGLWIVLHNTPLDAPIIWSAASMAGYSVTALFIAIMGVRSMRRSGLPALVAVMAGLGALVTLFTIDEYRGAELTIMILLGVFVPLIVGPAWLLLTENWRVRKAGLLVIWALMLFGMGLVPFLIYRSPGVDLPRLDTVLYNLGYALPIWVALWLALEVYEREAPQPEVTAPV
ncbi:MAG: hypothetical protein DWB42_13135 [Chloroflexi bacterium]|nr:hypothetical protein [Chloroflexota bacterium]MDL1885443.1 hypothetical protein [Anaerolineae bacterium CFX8]